MLLVTTGINNRFAIRAHRYPAQVSRRPVVAGISGLRVDDDIAIFVAHQPPVHPLIHHRRRAARPQAVFVKATYYAVVGQAAGKEVLEERQLLGIAVTITKTQITAHVKDPVVANDRLVPLRVVIEAVVLQIAAGRGDLKRSLLEGTASSQLATVESAANPIGGESKIVKHPTILVNKARLRIRVLVLRRQRRHREPLSVSYRTQPRVMVRRRRDVVRNAWVQDRC